MSDSGGFDTGRFARSLALIVFVTAVFLFLLADRLVADLFQVGVVAMGSVAIVTAIVSFLIAATSGYDS